MLTVIEKITHPSRTIFDRSLEPEDIPLAKPKINLLLGKSMKAMFGMGWGKLGGLFSMALGSNPPGDCCWISKWDVQVGERL